MKRVKTRVAALLLALLLLGAGAAGAMGANLVDIQDEAVPMAAAPNTVMPTASGKVTEKTDKAVIDYSNTADGYVMVQYTASTSKKLKVQVKTPGGVTYTYTIKAGQWATLPLSEGNGSYQVTVFENVTGTKYATVASVTCTAKLKSEYAPFLLPNLYVNYTADSKVVQKGQDLAGATTDPLQKVKLIYDYVVDNFTYDKQQAATVQSGYLPVVDSVLAQKKGICFDYAAVMAAMLRSQGVPTKLVVGYSGKVYHAWLNVYSEETGWVEGIVYFDGTSWQRMDPTFASGAKQSQDIMKYIGDGSNYSAKYTY